MGYPAAYRRGSSGYGGQGRGFQPSPSPVMPTPYSNPGWKPPPRPANDNFGRLMRAARLARRALPLLSAMEYALQWQEWWKQNTNTWHFPAPWVKQFSCSPGPPYSPSQWNWADLRVKSCLVGQASNNNLYNTPANILQRWPTAGYMLLECKYYNDYLRAWRSATLEQWTRPTTGPIPDAQKPYPDKVTVPVPPAPHEVPWNPPAINPEMPPAMPMPAPQPIPYPEIPYRPYPEVVHGPQRGYRPGVQQRPRPAPSPWSPGPVRPRPTTPVQPAPKPPVEYLPDSNPFPRQRPPKGERERKIMSDVQGYDSLLRWARRTETAKDAQDIVGAVHDALPEEYQTRSKRLQDQLAAIYRNINKLDAAKAIAGVMKELAEDRAGGLLDKARDKAGRKLGVTKQQIRTIQGL